jgi:hypothetical protein
MPTQIVTASAQWGKQSLDDYQVTFLDIGMR